ncbi:MAG: hypothetical protein NZ992_00185 [Candidatus Korarchaeum sp.]|nr:hypothetical protein [Candidatus Korarchaeum sp.]MDW8093339.1 hypothetical protein [Nitrososphaerota archaeon]
MSLNETLNQTLNQTAVGKVISGLSQLIDGLSHIVNDFLAGVLRIIGLDLAPSFIWLLGQLLIWGSALWIIKKFTFGKIKLFLLIFVLFLAFNYLLSSAFNFDVLRILFGVRG